VKEPGSQSRHGRLRHIHQRACDDRHVEPHGIRTRAP
jgi:hypothetical protein